MAEHSSADNLFVAITRLALLRIGEIKKGVDK